MTVMDKEHKYGVIRTSVRVMAVGVGGMGVQAIDWLLDAGLDEMDYVAVDTDLSMLTASKVPRQIQIGTQITRGHSTGGDADLGRRCANGDFAKLRELFTNTDVVIILAGLGGGVGSGGAPAIAQTAQDEGALVISVATTPFDFEGEDRLNEASDATIRLREASHALILLPNQELVQEMPDKGMAIEDSFRRGVVQLGQGMRLLWQLLAQRNLINLDFINLKNMLEMSGGSCRLVFAEANGESKVALTLNRLRHHPALISEQQKEAGSLLIGIQGSADLTLHQVQELVQGVTEGIHANAKRFIGVGIDYHSRDRLAVLLLIGEKTKESGEEKAAPSVVKPRRKIAHTGPHLKSGAKRTEQKELDLPTSNHKGRFNNVEPTIVQGQDLDIPTFFRRQMKLIR
jgi:cell division protein FtsZ